MACKLVKPGFITIAEFARKLGVSGQAVSQAVQRGRLVAYDSHGKRVPPDYAGRKWLDAAEAAEDWDNRRQRYDEKVRSDDLLAARGRTAALHGELLSLRLGRERGDTIPRGEALAGVQSLGAATQRAFKGIPGWAEELVAAEQEGGLAAVSVVLQAKSTELGNAIGNLIAAASEDRTEYPTDAY